MRTRAKVFLCGLGIVVGVGSGVCTHSSNKNTAEVPVLQETLPESVWGRYVPAEASQGTGVYLSETEDDPKNPQASSYDPVFLLRATGKAPFEVFEAEAVDTKWAPEMKQVTEAHFVDDLKLLDANVNVEDVECRTSSCKVILSGDDAELFKINGSWLASFSEHTSLGPGPQLDDGKSRYYIYLGFTNDNRSLVAHNIWYQRHRQELIEVLRERGTLPAGLGEDD